MASQGREQPVDRQDHPPGLRRDRLQPVGAGTRQGQQLVVAVHEVADAADADRHAATDQFGVDLWDATMLDVPQLAHQGDGVEAEFAPRRDEPPLISRARDKFRDGGAPGSGNRGPGVATG